ncbi:alpha/beta hydrolase [Williamsia sp.]|uniref:alpha/beta fold hydrolase n=1 Tax=Williamsia sp. TaxID=1872085 RepID=UPI002F94419F
MSTHTVPVRMSLDGPAGKLSYLRWSADSERAPILCLHPVNTAAAVWTEMIAGLPDRDVVAIDYRGHGHSAVGGPYFPVDYASDALALFAALGYQKVHLLGGSIGGAVAVEFAVANPDAVASISLFGATLHLGLAADQLEPMVDALRQMGVRQWFGEHGGEILGHRAAPDAPGTLVRLAAGRDIEAVIEILTTTFGKADSRPVADALARSGSVPPSLVVVGRDDPTCPPTMAADLAGYLSATVTTMEGVGHLPMLETPGEAADLVSTFLAGLESSEEGR